jgi:nucleoside-diphosphate-sugar epimerase
MRNKKRILITGYEGFVGKFLQPLLKNNFHITSISRRKSVCSASNEVIIADLVTNQDSVLVPFGTEVVIHLAGRAHVMNETEEEALEQYRNVNVKVTENLAKQAVGVGVKRFIYMSSIKAMGESTSGQSPYSEESELKPEDPYGVSKMEAEEVLKKIAKDSGMELVIIRPPLVYGPGVRANFLSLIKLASSRLPLPFSIVNNQRSMVFAGNLADFVTICIDHPKAANQVFLVSDDNDISIRTLIKQIRRKIGVPNLEIPVPIKLFLLIGRLTGKTSLVDRLVGDLQVNIFKAKRELGWAPPFSFDHGISKTVASIKEKVLSDD